MMMRIAAVFTALCAWLRLWFARPIRPLQTVRAEELPERLDPRSVYVLGEGKHLWFVVMICPCGCKAKLEMSLLADAKPRWRLIEHADGTISLQPSVWRKIGCRSHFFLRRGLIRWSSESLHS
jgi:hypothetical protein